MTLLSNRSSEAASVKEFSCMLVSWTWDQVDYSRHFAQFHRCESHTSNLYSVLIKHFWDKHFLDSNSTVPMVGISLKGKVLNSACFSFLWVGRLVIIGNLFPFFKSYSPSSHNSLHLYVPCMSVSFSVKMVSNNTSSRGLLWRLRILRNI